MALPITDQVGFLGEACRACQELSANKGSLEKLRLEEKRLEKELETERKAVADAVSLTVKQRMEEISSTYDKEIAKGQERLKRVRSKREKAKSQGMKERIAEETKYLNDYNRELELQIKTSFQQDHVPRFCKSTLFYALYMPRGFSEFLLLFLTILICFLGAPYGIYLELPEKSSYYLVGIYFIDILLFGGLYIFINNRTKVHHQTALKKGRAIRDLIRSNRKKIKVITSSIKRDRDEAVYDLEKYDDEIAQIEQDLANITNKKKDALHTFDKVTKTIIADEIAAGSREKIAGLKESHERAASAAREAQEQVKEQTLYLTDHYEVYIGKEFMSPETLDELADMIRLGKAATISEAEALYRETKR